MGTNFNNIGKMGSVNGLETKEPEKTPKKDDTKELKKKLIKIMALISAGVVLLLIILLLTSLLIKKQYTYEDIEGVLKNAAISYFNENKENLPSNEKQLVEVESSTLVAAEKMKELTEYTKEGISCTGKVMVGKSGNDYVYTPYLDCGEDYATKELYKIITDASNIVTSGYGLYNYNNAYIYRGESVNNYVQMDEGLWRIVKVTSENNIVLIKDEAIKMSVPWDDRYNTSVGYNIGINNYTASRMKEYLATVYKSKDEYEKFLSSNDKSKLTSYNLCIGKRKKEETINDNTIECKEVLDSQKVGLLTVSDYINASVDVGCTTGMSPSCQNYNYLITDYQWWTTTAIEGTTSDVYVVEEEGTLDKSSASNYAYSRPVVYLNSKILYKSGKGTKTKPYIIK